MAPKTRGAKAKPKAKPEPVKQEPPAKRRRKKTGEADPPLEQLPPEQVVKYQMQWEKFGLQPKKDTKAVENDQQAQSSGSGGEKQEPVKQATYLYEIVFVLNSVLFSRVSYCVKLQFQ